MGTKLDLRQSEEQLAQLKKEGITPISTEMVRYFILRNLAHNYLYFIFFQGKSLAKESGARGYYEVRI